MYISGKTFVELDIALQNLSEALLTLLHASIQSFEETFEEIAKLTKEYDVITVLKYKQKMKMCYKYNIMRQNELYRNKLSLTRRQPIVSRPLNRPMFVRRLP